MLRYDPRAERATRDIVSRAIFARDARRAARRRTAASTCSMSHLGPEQRAPAVQGHGRALRRLRLRSRGRTGRGRAHRALHDGRRRVRAPIARRRCRACSPPARTPAACTAPTGWAATASRTRRCSAASRATAIAAWLRSGPARLREPDDEPRSRRRSRARGALRRAGGRARADPRRALRLHVGRRRHPARRADGARARARDARRPRRRARSDGRRRRRPRVQPRLARLAQPGKPGRREPRDRAGGARARRLARRAFSRGCTRSRATSSIRPIRRQTGPTRGRISREPVRFTRRSPEPCR